MKVRKKYFLWGLTMLAATRIAAQSVWISTTDGDWTVAGNWQDDAIPATGSSVDINADGTYTSLWQNNNLRISLGAVSVGTSSSSGTQTLTVAGNAFQQATVNLAVAVGPRGVINQRMSLAELVGSTQYVFLANGAVYKSTSTDSRAWSLGNCRVLDMEAGALIELAEGSGLMICHQDDWATIDGVISGSGLLGIPGGGAARIRGSGTIDGSGIFEIPYNGHLYLGGTLTINRDFAKPAGHDNLGSIRFIDGADIEINGDIKWDLVERAFWVDTASDTATVGGSGTIDIQFAASSGDTTRFGGGGGGYNAGGTMTLEGSGKLILRMCNDAVDQYYSRLVLARDTYVLGAGTFSNGLGRVIEVTNTNGRLTIASNATIRVARDAAYGDYSYLRVRDGGTLRLGDAMVVGNAVGADPYAVHLSDDGSTAALELLAGTTQLVAGVSSEELLSLRLGSGTAVVAGGDSDIYFQDALFYVAITNSADWGLSENGAIGVGSNVSLEALSSDRGAALPRGTATFTINKLRFGAEASGLTLIESADNDGDGADRVIYVKTLDLSELPGGSLDLGGLGGEEKVYFYRLVNPNGVTFVESAKWVQMAMGTVIKLM